jgi:hypothetical protein
MNNPPAFPLNTPKWHESVSDAGFQDIDFTMGMTLRDYFAAKAMQGLISSHWCEEARVLSPKLGAEELATDAYIMANAMLKAREA